MAGRRKDRARVCGRSRAMTWPLFARGIVVALLGLGTVACKKDVPYCGDAKTSTVGLGEEWKALALPIPKNARTCQSDERTMVVAGEGNETHLFDQASKSLETQGFVLD